MMKILLGTYFSSSENTFLFKCFAYYHVNLKDITVNFKHTLQAL